MATTLTIQIPKQAPMVTDTKQVSREWSRYFDLLTAQGSAGAGSVMSVSGAAPIASTGGANPVISLNDTAVTPATYGDSTHVGQFTVDQKGRLTFAQNVAITGTGTVTHTAGNLTLNELVLGNGGADIKVVAATDGQIPIGKTSDGTVTLATITAGTGITVTNAGGSITIAATGSGGGSTLLGYDRLTGDGATTTFNLADVAEYVLDISDAGAIVDPSLITLSSDHTQVTFSSAPTAGHVLTFEYVIAQI